MSFKLIQELNKTTYKIIPESFEQNGVFWYPPPSLGSTKQNSLIKNQFALPDKSNWEANQCVVKKSRIDTYKEAEKHKKQLLQNPSLCPSDNVIVNLKSEESSDDDEDSLYVTSQLLNPPSVKVSTDTQNTEPKRPPQSVPVRTNVNYYEDLWECLDASTTLCDLRSRIQAVTNPKPIVTDAKNENCAVVDLGTPHQNIESEVKPEKDGDSESDECTATPTEKSHSNRTQILAEILKNQRDHQDAISKKLEEVKTCIVEGLSKVFTGLETLTQIQYSNSLSSVNPDINPKKFCIENFKKVSTCEEANRLEKMLMFSEFKADMIEKMSNIIGQNRSRVGEGWECCYDLVESIFQRKFLKICSWTGASTSEMEEAKIAFLKYKNIISFFASVILNADPEFSLEDTKEFFKKVLRSSSKFLNQNNRDQKSERKSSKRRKIQGTDPSQPRKSIKRKKVQSSQSETQNDLKNGNIEKKTILTEKPVNYCLFDDTLLFNDINHEEESDDQIQN